MGFKVQDSMFKAKGRVGTIRKDQIIKIHALKHVLGMSEEEYRQRLLNRYGSSSSKFLSTGEADEFISYLEAEAVEKGVWVDYGALNRYRFQHLKDRPGMAAPGQLRKIEAMWKEVSRKRSRAERERALRAFLKRLVGVEDLRFLESWHVPKVLMALEKMKERRQKQCSAYTG